MKKILIELTGIGFLSVPSRLNAAGVKDTIYPGAFSWGDLLIFIILSAILLLILINIWPNDKNPFNRK
jgi:hypothetical protein